MLLLGAILLIGLFVGWGFGGSLRKLAAVRIGLWPVAIAGVILQWIPVPDLGAATRLVSVGLLFLSLFGILVVAAVNRHLPGFLFIFVGILLNAVVISANLGMPVSEDAVRRSGQAAGIDRLQDGSDPKHHLADDDDVLLPLADVIPVGDPFRIVVSIGDVVAYAGAAVFVAAAMLGRGPRRPSSPGRPPVARART